MAAMEKMCFTGAAVVTCLMDKLEMTLSTAMVVMSSFQEMPVQISNVLLVCTACGKAARTGARFLADGSKVRYCKKCDAAIGQLAPAREAHVKDATKTTAAKTPAAKK